MQTLPIQFDQHRVQDFCTRWGIGELWLFGSVLRNDFGPYSDVDVLISFRDDRTMNFEGYVEMREELSDIFEGRNIDLVETKRLADPYRRHEIFRTRERLYAH